MSKYTPSTSHPELPLSEIKYCECGCGQLLPHPKSPSHQRRFIKGHQYYRASIEERFWQHVTPTDGEWCWLWQGPVFSNGYGRLTVNRRALLTHRVAWELAHGPIPEGLIVMHRCDTPGCVRASHLQLGTYADNSADMVQKGRHDLRVGEEHPSYGRLNTHCAKGHELTDDNVIWTNHGQARRCLICYRTSSRAGALRYLDSHREQVNQKKRERREPLKVGAATGERHGLTTLTGQEVVEIRRLHSEGNTTFVFLAATYHVSAATIANIIHRKTWKRVP